MVGVVGVVEFGWGVYIHPLGEPGIIDTAGSRRADEGRCVGGGGDGVIADLMPNRHLQ